MNIKKPVPPGLKVQPAPPKPKDMTEEILAPFLSAKNELEISYATNRLRTNLRRGKEGYTADAVKKAAKEAPENVAESILKATETPGQVLPGKRSVAQHRANLIELEATRGSDHKILKGIYSCLIDILEAK